MINACVFDRRKVSWARGWGRGGEEKWNYNTKQTYSETNKTIIVKVTWHRTRTGMHTQRKQNWKCGCQSRADSDNRHLEKDLTGPQTSQTPQPQALPFSCSCASLSLSSGSLRPSRSYNSPKNISLSWPCIFKSYSVDI